MGPVSVELPIDVQAAEIDLPLNLGPVKALELPQAEQAEIDLLVSEIKSKTPDFLDWWWNFK